MKNELYIKAIDKFGANHQLLKCAEECCELAQAIIKQVNSGGGRDKIIAELSDVYLTCEQLERILNIETDELFYNETKSLERLREALR